MFNLKNNQLSTSNLEKQIFRNIDHPEAGFLPTAFLLEFANPYVENQQLNNTLDKIPADKLWQELNVIGMQQPFILRICLAKKTVRLETGNQRIRLFQKYGIKQVPVIVELASTPIADRKNGDQIRPLKSNDFNIEKLEACRNKWCNPLDIITPHHNQATLEITGQLKSRAMRHHILMQTQ